MSFEINRSEVKVHACYTINGSLSVQQIKHTHLTICRAVRGCRGVKDWHNKKFIDF